MDISWTPTSGAHVIAARFGDVPKRSHLDRVAAINHQRVARDETRPFRTKPERRLSHILRAPQAAQRYARRQLGVVRRITPFAPLLHRRLDRSRTYRVDPNPFSGVIARRRPRQSDDTVLARDIGWRAPRAAQSHD